MSVKLCIKCKEYFPLRYPGLPDKREDYFHIDHSGHPITISDSTELNSEYQDASPRYSFLFR